MAVAPATSLKIPLPSSTTRRRPPRPRCRARHRPSRRSHTPSVGLLSLLATLSGFDTADGSPIDSQQFTPPPFLCPFIDQDDTTDIAECSSKRPLSTNRNVKRHYVPEKWEPDDDEVWRRAPTYTLYGSTLCPGCESSTTTVPTNNMVQPTSHTASSSATPTKEILDMLPNGWQPSGTVTGGRTTIILALSLVLAFSICALMVGCIFWRRKRRKDCDTEMKLRKRTRALREEEEAAGRQIRSSQKIWAKATARWKANARVRQRQRRRHPSGSHARSTSVSLRNLQIVSSSHSPSRPSSPQLSTLSVPDQSHSSAVSLHSAQENECPTPIPPTDLAFGHPLPPAYHHEQRPPMIVVTTPILHSDGNDPSRLPGPDLVKRSEYAAGGADDSVPADDYIPYSPSLDTAHVAIDDKGLLARMSDLASAPPGATSEGRSSIGEVSAPVWQDEELQECPQPFDDHDTCSTQMPSHVPSPLLPAPPLKDKMATGLLYDYSYSFEELGYEDEPSAPPFEAEVPSAPPMEGTAIEASAPPLEEIGEVPGR